MNRPGASRDPGASTLTGISPAATRPGDLVEYVVRRLALAGITLLILTATVYVAVRLLPGDPTWGEEAQLRPFVDQWIQYIHADEPIFRGYMRWLAGVARGDLGISIAVRPGSPVGTIVRETLPWTITLGTLGFLTTFLLAIPLGILGAWRPEGPVTRTTTALLYLLYALPAFWIALALQDGIAARLRLLPALGTAPGAGSGGLPSPAHWVLPTAALSLGSLTFVIRFCRSSILESSRREYARAARARGAGDGRVLLRHALANTAVPLISLAGLMLPEVIAGSVVIETVFALPGIGRLFFVAAGRRDYPVIMALSLMSASATLLVTLAADLLYRAADPRFDLEGGPGEDR